MKRRVELRKHVISPNIGALTWFESCKTLRRRIWLTELARIGSSAEKVDVPFMRTVI